MVVPDPPPLSDVVVVVARQPGDVDALLAPVDRVIAAMGARTVVP